MEELSQAVTEATHVDVDYLEPVYQEFGVVLDDQVRRRFEEVQTFHPSVVRNRRRFLEAELLNSPHVWRRAAPMGPAR